MTSTAYSQQLPHSIRTTYVQLSIGTANGTNQQLEPKPMCLFWYFDEIANGKIPNGACDAVNNDNFMITTSDPTKSDQYGWSKRFFGYDPTRKSYMKDGSLIEDVALTIIFRDGKYTILYVVSGVDPDTGKTTASSAIKYYNL